MFIQPELSNDRIPLPRSTNIEEVWLFIGHALYAVQHVEHSVLDTLTAIDPTLRMKSKATFGYLVQELKLKRKPSGELQSRLDNLIAKRNDLAHNFLRMHWKDLNSCEGRVRILSDLRCLIVFAFDTENILTGEYLDLYWRSNEGC